MDRKWNNNKFSGQIRNVFCSEISIFELKFVNGKNVSHRYKTNSCKKFTKLIEKSHVIIEIFRRDWVVSIIIKLGKNVASSLT